MTDARIDGMNTQDYIGYAHVDALSLARWRPTSGVVVIFVGMVST